MGPKISVILLEIFFLKCINNLSIFIQLETIFERSPDFLDPLYTGNAGQFKEALEEYGTISTSGDISDQEAMPGAIPFSAYYLADGEDIFIDNLDDNI
jgi:hypothetical protein